MLILITLARRHRPLAWWGVPMGWCLLVVAATALPRWWAAVVRPQPPGAAAPAPGAPHALTACTTQQAVLAADLDRPDQQHRHPGTP
ncbi:hypothetical protein QJS66_11780 [Kocuria rhizophila]|nr:hypothetical protein QJS66_11780 [Kocuria rhizophila]